MSQQVETKFTYSSSGIALMRVLRWIVSIGIGVLFGWLTFKDGHFSALFASEIHWIDGYLNGALVNRTAKVHFFEFRRRRSIAAPYRCKEAY